jgi:hypothetical protein
MGGRIPAWALAAAIACGLIAAPAAEASFHLIDVREVHPGTAEDSYVELQMYSGGETFLGGHSLTLYSAAGALAHTSTFSANVANGQNQSTVLVGDSGVQAALGELQRRRRLPDGDQHHRRLARLPRRDHRRQGDPADDRTGLPDPPREQRR